MIAQIFLTTILLQQRQQTFGNLNFSEIGLSWKSDALYVLYNKETIVERQFLDLVDDILEGGKGYFAQRPYVVADTVASTRYLKELGTFSTKSLIVVVMLNVLDTAWQRTAEITRFIKTACTVFLIKETTNDSHGMEMQDFFNNLWHAQFRRVLVATSWNQELLSMKAYPKVEIINVTNNLTREYFPPFFNWNLEGYVLKVPVQMDVPNIFWYYDHQLQRYRLDGVGGRVFEHFMKSLNVKLNVYPLYAHDSNTLNFTIIEGMIMRGELEISSHWYTTFEAKDLAYSYPYVASPRCIILPEDNYNNFRMLPNYWTIWVIIALFVVTAEIIFHFDARRHWLCTRNCQRLHTPGTATFFIICVLIGFPLPYKQIFNIQNMPMAPFIRTLFIFPLITIGGFCFMQIYSTTLTSRLAASYQIGSSITTQQILDMDKKIMLPKKDMKYIVDAPTVGPQAAFKLHVTSYEEFQDCRLSLNTSFIYPISLERWSVVKEQQFFLKFKRFWCSNICYGAYPVQYQMRHDSPFLQYLYWFELYMWEAGLHQAWKQRVIRRAIKMGYLHYFTDFNDKLVVEQKYGNFNKTVKHLSVFFYSCGLVVSLTTFALEVLSKKYGKWRPKKTSDVNKGRKKEDI